MTANLYILTLLTLLVLVPSNSQLAATIPDPFENAQETAAIITVNSLADDLLANGNCTLREAVWAANFNIAYDGCAAGTETLIPDKILFAVNGTIFLSAALGEIVVTNSLIIEGNGRDNTIIDGGDQIRLFSGTGGLLFELSSLTLQNGSAENPNPSGQENGGAIHNSGAVLTLNDVVIQDCQSTSTNASGGAIYTESGLIINDSLLQRNETHLRGGAIYASETIIDIDNTIIRENDVQFGDGGGLAFFDSEVTITNSLIESNESHLSFNGGGGIAGLDSYTKSVNIMDTIISGNIVSWADFGGGGIYCECGLKLFASTVADNKAIGLNDDERGGGLFGLGSWIISHSAIYNNEADSGRGGGIYHTEGLLSLTNSTVSHNTAQKGGGLYLGNSLASVRFSTVSSNIATDWGSAFYISGTNSLVTLTGTIVADHDGDALFCFHDDKMTSAGSNILPNDDGDCVAPLPSDLVGVDARLGPLQGNGGPTFTHALLPDSPAVDFATCLNDVDFDQRYAKRPLASDCDSGAYELWQLSIAPRYPDDAGVSWESVFPLGCTYDLFESTIPYFTPSGLPTYANVNSVYTVNGRLGSPTTNYFFINRADCGGEYSIYSNTVGEFDYALVPGS